MTKPKKYVLKNGLTLVVVPMGDVPTVTALVLVGTGSDYESKNVNGISHFLEHMCFKGTSKRPSAQAISHELDALGSQYNAFTDHELTGYYAKADAKKFKKIFEIISDIYLNSTFPEAEIEKEKGVIVEEINMYEDMPQRHVQDIFQELLYGDQSAGRNIAGTKENVRKMTRDDFIKYKNAHYVPKATTIVIAGHITIKGALEEARKHFGKMEHGVKSKKPRTKDSQKSPKVLISFKKTDQTHFVLGMRSYDLFSKKNTVLSVLGGVLGAGMSSRLFIKLREEMGAAYYVNAYNNVSLDHGVFQISAGVTNARTKEVISEILKECKKLKDEIIGEAELQKVKSFIIGNMKLSLEATDDVANFYGIQQLLKGEMKNIEEKAREIEKITSQDIQKIAREIFLKNQLNLCLIGPHTEKSGFMKILTI